MLVRRAEIKDIEKINELLLQVAMVHHLAGLICSRRIAVSIKMTSLLKS